MASDSDRGIKPTHRKSVLSCFAALFLAQVLSGAVEDQVYRQVQKLVSMQRAWGSKMNSTGAMLALREGSRTQTDGHTIVRYRMITSGLPKDKTYSIMMWQLNAQPQVTLSGVTIDETGTAVCAGRAGTCGTPDKPDDPIDLAMLAGPGEPKRIALIAVDNSAQAFASVVPFPIHNSDGGCSLEALLVTPNAEAVLVSLTGFKPGVSLDLESTSESEAGRSSGKADEKGNYEWIILPFRKGLTKGRTQVTVHADGCSPTLSFAWGTGSYVLQ